MKGIKLIANNAIMELKNINPNGNNVGASNLINVNFLFFENCENWVQKQTSQVIFSKRCYDCPKKEFLILFTSQINIEWIKSFHVYMDLFYKKIKLWLFRSFFGVLVAIWMTRKKHSRQYNFFYKNPREKECISTPLNKVSKNCNENWHHGNLPKLPIVPHKDYDHFEVKKFSKIYFPSTQE
jgi:hypothetical protein